MKFVSITTTAALLLGLLLIEGTALARGPREFARERVGRLIPHETTRDVIAEMRRLQAEEARRPGSKAWSESGLKKFFDTLPEDVKTQLDIAGNEKATEGARREAIRNLHEKFWERAANFEVKNGEMLVSVDGTRLRFDHLDSMWREAVARQENRQESELAHQAHRARLAALRGAELEAKTSVLKAAEDLANQTGLRAIESEVGSVVREGRLPQAANERLAMVLEKARERHEELKSKPEEATEFARQTREVLDTVLNSERDARKDLEFVYGVLSVEDAAQRATAMKALEILGEPYNRTFRELLKEKARELGIENPPDSIAELRALLEGMEGVDIALIRAKVEESTQRAGEEFAKSLKRLIEERGIKEEDLVALFKKRPPCLPKALVRACAIYCTAATLPILAATAQETMASEIAEPRSEQVTPLATVDETHPGTVGAGYMPSSEQRRRPVQK